MKCKDCQAFKPGTPGGLADCKKKVERWTVMRGWEAGKWKTWQQQVLPWPGQAACVEFEGAISKNV